jgi:predicted glycoside hydrolase/deacetylase ChbG (UPF0249 family)
MLIPKNVLANADDLGLNSSINTAILNCFKNGYINSASLITNTSAYAEAVTMIHQNPCMQNIGIHINLAEGEPLVFNNRKFLDACGSWNINVTNRKLLLLTRKEENEFLNEIYAQVDKAVASNIALTHIDSHYHLHTLPCFYKLFIKVAKHYNLKIRLAQTYREGSYLKFWFRKYINSVFIKCGQNYTMRFESVDRFLNIFKTGSTDNSTEVMLHPIMGVNDTLTDHVDANTMTKWLAFLDRHRSTSV